MIVEFLFTILLFVIEPLIGALPEISMELSMNEFAASAWEFIQAVLYFLPVHTVVIVLSYVFAFRIFRIIVALVKTLWDILPLV